MVRAVWDGIAGSPVFRMRRNRFSQLN
jgi:hypothetical protein